MEETLPSYISRSSAWVLFGIKRISTGVRSVTNTCRFINRLLFLDDWQEIPEEKYRPGYEKRNDLPNHAHCKIKR